MASPEEKFETLAKNMERYEHQARRRAWLLTVIPFLLAVLLMGYTSRQIAQLADTETKLAETTATLGSTQKKLDDTTSRLALADRDLSGLQTQVADVQTSLDKAQADFWQAQSYLATATAQLEQAQAALDEARVFVKNACRLSEEALKDYVSNGTPEARMLNYLLDKQRTVPPIPWKPGGFSETEGFDSPRFALYALQNNGWLPLDYGPDKFLWNILSPIDRPQDGDLVYYESGFTMFYYNIPVSYGGFETVNCLIGMTPLGIQAQLMDQVDWHRLGFLKAPYH